MTQTRGGSHSPTAAEIARARRVEESKREVPASARGLTACMQVRER